MFFDKTKVPRKSNSNTKSEHQTDPSALHAWAEKRNCDGGSTYYPAAVSCCLLRADKWLLGMCAVTVLAFGC